MRRLWLFNPENDIALASGQRNFTAPAAAMKLRQEGQTLPFFLAGEGDSVLCNGVNRQWFEEFRSKYNLKATLWDHNPAGLIPTPWGWSAAVKAYFEKLGFGPDVLPSDEVIERYRELSHRRYAARLSGWLSENTSLSIWPAAVEVSDVDELRRIIIDYGKAVVKQPWSSSGRGVHFIDIANVKIDNVLKQLEGTIRRQGSVMVERWMSEHFGCALLFFKTADMVKFEGYSVFNTADGTGRYAGNMVASQEDLRRTILGHLSESQLDELVSGLLRALSAVYEGYEGPIGVDLCLSRGMVHICEANLRYTMGFVAKGEWEAGAEVLKF